MSIPLAYRPAVPVPTSTTAPDGGWLSSWRCHLSWPWQWWTETGLVLYPDMRHKGQLPRVHVEPWLFVGLSRTLDNSATQTHENLKVVRQSNEFMKIFHNHEQMIYENISYVKSPFADSRTRWISC